MLTVSVLGLGLIGGSLLRALAAAGHQVRGFDIDPDTRAAARGDAPTTSAARGGDPEVTRGRWRIVDTIPDAITDTDLVVLAVPLPAIGALIDHLAAERYPGIVTDVTSTKGPVRALFAERFPTARYVGGHPMAGKETSGFAASDPELFSGCSWVLTLDGADSAALRDWLTVAELVVGLGARVVPVTTSDHDAVVARISHLPHLTAAAIAATAGTKLAATLAAGSYRDSTRVAASAPPLVAAMCGGNAAALAAALDHLIDELTEARRRLAQPDPITAITTWLEAGHRARIGWPPRAGSSEEIAVSTEALLGLGRDGGWITAVAADRRTVTAVRPLQ